MGRSLRKGSLSLDAIPDAVMRATHRDEVRTVSNTANDIASTSLEPAAHFVQLLCMESMSKPPLNPDVADEAPKAPTLTAYDKDHLVTYLRLLDADAEGADWREVAQLVLHIDANREPDRARRAFDSHLARARWMTEQGYRDLLRGSAPQ